MRRRPPPEEMPAAVESAAEALIVLWGRAQEALGTFASPPQLRVLLIVARHGPLNINGLAERLGAIPSSTSRLCDRLESAGFLTRGSVARDRREVAVSLTPAGRDLLAELGRRRRADLEDVLEQMAPAAQAALLEGLRAFQSAAEQSGTVAGDASDQLPA
jgi:DNA-binding MarR family transcriptional regulator